MPSVHLQNFPNVHSFIAYNDIVNKMDQAREICNCVASLRKEANIRVRMPLKKITICGKHDLNNEYLELIKQETNVKEIVCFNSNLEEIATQEVVLNMKECGKTYGAKLKDILLAQKKREWSIKDNQLIIANCVIPNDMFSILWIAKNGSKAMQCEHFNLLVFVDTELTQDLIIEGLARDVVRIIQQTRKDNKFEISDTINVVLHTTDEIFNDVLSVWKQYICYQTLASSIIMDTNIADKNSLFEVDGYKFSVNLSKS